MKHGNIPGGARIVVHLPPEWRAFGALGAAVLLYEYFRPLLFLGLLFALGLLLAAILHPSVTWLQERVHLPRIVPALCVVLGILVVLFAIVNWGIPYLLGQAAQLADNVPAVYEKGQRVMQAFALKNPVLAEYLQRQAEHIQTQRFFAEAVSRLGTLGISLGGVFLAGILVLAVTLYTVVYPLPLVSGLLVLWPPAARERVAQSVNASVENVRAWMGAQLLAMLFIGVLSGLMLWFLGIPYSILFAVLAGLLEIVPTVGPILGALGPMLLASTQAPILALWVGLAFFAVQQFENHVLIPLVMAGALRMHPVPILFAVIVMGALFGMLGIFMAIPLMAVAQAVYQEMHQRPVGEQQRAARQARTALAMHDPDEGK